MLILAALSLLGMAILWAVYGWLPPQKSNLAPVIDEVFNFVNGASAALTLGVVTWMMYLMWTYIRKDSTERAEEVHPSKITEAAWVVLPTILVMVIFVWGFKAFVKVTVAPPDAYQIYVQGRKWAWEFQYPSGKVTNELLVPIDRPVKLIMTSDDVLHSFFIPDFRVKHDLIPNRYSSIWFIANELTSNTADVEGADFVQVFCAEYCGDAHSRMATRLHVLPEDVFMEWVNTVENAAPTAEYGEGLYATKACVTCHSLDGSATVGPTFQGLFGRQEQLNDGSSVQVDEEYLRESIVEPGAKIVNGYQNVMPMMTLDDTEVQALVEYIKSVQ